MKYHFIVFFINSITVNCKRINLRFPNAITNIDNNDVYDTLFENVTSTVKTSISSVLNNNVILREGLSGATAGGIQVLTLMWLRTIVSYQSNYDVGFFTAVQNLYSDGGIGRFYRGLSMALIQGPLSRFGQITANEIATGVIEYCATVSMFNFISVSPAALGSVLSGLWRVVLMPIDTIKVSVK